MILGLLLFFSMQAILFLPTPHNALAVFLIWIIGMPFVLHFMRSSR